jgi:hypothetical protein
MVFILSALPPAVEPTNRTRRPVITAIRLQCRGNIEDGEPPLKEQTA